MKGGRNVVQGPFNNYRTIEQKPLRTEVNLKA